MNKKTFGGLAAVAVVIVGLFWLNNNRVKNSATSLSNSNVSPIASENTPRGEAVAGNAANNSPQTPPKTPDEEVIAQNLKIPWEIVFLPDGSMLVTERPGTLQRITPNKVVIPIAGVAHVGEGGLLGMALHPDFKNNHFIYLYATTRVGSALRNRVERYKLENDKLSDRKVIIEGIPGSSNHDGGRLAFGPDKDLYITTGDAEQSQLAQDTNSLAGKILRLKDDGSIPADNPFNNAVYSYGHRNPQGLAWDDQGRLWATEHGPSGAQTGDDELNRIEKGKNYGWPTIKGSQTKDGLQTPIINSGTKETWAPAGLAFYKGSLFFGGLKGQTLYIAKIKPDGGVDLTRHLQNKYGRLRAAVIGPDGYLYLSTSNTDGRGTVKVGDDKIIKVKLQIFQ